MWPAAVAHGWDPTLTEEKESGAWLLITLPGWRCHEAGCLALHAAMPAYHGQTFNQSQPSLSSSSCTGQMVTAVRTNTNSPFIPPFLQLNTDLDAPGEGGSSTEKLFSIQIACKYVCGVLSWLVMVWPWVGGSGVYRKATEQAMKNKASRSISPWSLLLVPTSRSCCVFAQCTMTWDM